jgi:type VI secretion system protein ImpA
MNIEWFLAPLDATNPSGIDLRNDGRFHAIERLLEPASREARLKAVASGGSGAVALDWAQILDDARTLAAMGRDLRLLVIIVRAMTNESGFAGLAEGLGLLTRTISQYWDSLHPALRPDPSRREAALRRINALYQLESTDNGVLGDLEFNTFLNPRGLGPISGGDLAAACLSRNIFLNEAPQGLGEKETAQLVAKHEARVNRVTAACRATAAERPEELDALIAGLAAAQAARAGLEAALDPLVTENAIAVKFNRLSQFLTRVEQTLLTAKSTASVTERPAMSAQPASTDSPSAAPAPSGAAVPGRITSRSEVERSLDLIIDFYERTEPSSPIPHLARRMRKMVPMNFIQLMEEVAPGGMKEFRSLAGIMDEKPK